MRPISEWHHVYVEMHVEFWRDDAGLNCRTPVPRWYARLWNYPDSAWRGPKYKSTGYHVGHWTAVLSLVAPIVYLLV